MIIESGRDVAEFALPFVRNTDPTATLCLDGDEWVIDVEESESRECIRAKVVRVGAGGFRVPVAKAA